jgi:hypothetical protein
MFNDPDGLEFESIFGSLKKANAPVEELPDPLDVNFEYAKATGNTGTIMRKAFVDDVVGDTTFESPTDTALRKMKAMGFDDNLQKRAKGNVLVKFKDGREILNPVYNRADDSWKKDNVLYRGEVVEIEMQEV